MVDLSSTSINHLETIGHNVDQNTGLIWRRTVNHTKMKLLQIILFILYCPCFIYNYYQKQIHEYKNNFNIFTTHMRTIFGVGPSIWLHNIIYTDVCNIYNIRFNNKTIIIDI